MCLALQLFPLILSASDAAEPVAADLPQPPTQVVQAAPTREANRMYVGVRGSGAMPIGAVGIASSVGFSLGAQFRSGSALGLRVLVIPNPPNVFGLDPGPVAVGPLVEFSHHLQVTENMAIAPGGSAGFALSQDSNRVNVAIPLLTTGIGVRLSKKTQGSELYVTPEFGYSVTANAPYMALGAGTIF